MSTITTLQIWRDTGFTEGCLDMPSKTSSLGTATFTFNNLNVSRDRMFSEVQVKAPYEDLYDCSYLKATYDFNNGYDVVVYGWIDKVICSSDTESSPMTRILWHIDYWRTYLSKAVFGNGIVKRRPLKSADTVPPQAYPYRFVEYSGAYPLLCPQYWAVIFSFNRRSTDANATSTTYWGCYAVDKNNPSTGIKVSGASTASPTLNDTLSGRFDEMLGLDPDSINSIFLSPVFPRPAPSSITPLTMDGWQWSTDICNGLALVARTKNAFAGNVTTVISGMVGSKTSDDTTQYIVCDMQGYPIGTMPWGMTFTYLRYSLVASTVSCYVRLELLSSTSQSMIDAVNEGRVFTSPCINVGLNSNSTSSYVFSGAREAEKEQMKLQTEQAHEQGLANTANSMIEGATAGAVMGSAGGPIGMAVGAVVGAVTSAVGNYLTTEATYDISSRYNDKFMKLSDYAHAKQTSVNLMPSGSFDPLTNGVNGFNLIRMTKDSYSVNQRANDIEMYGVNVEEPTTSCQSLVNAGGPLQIVNLTVTGNIPVEAKQYFRGILGRGVRIV